MPQGAFPGSPILLGKDAKIRIGPQTTLLGVRSGSITIRAAEHEVGDTEDAVGGGLQTGAQFLNVGPHAPAQGTVVGYMAHQGGRQSADVTMTWYSNFALVPAATALNIMAGAIITNFYIFPKGDVTALAQAWQFPYFQILENAPMRLDINQPQEGSFSGKNMGTFSAPTA